MSETPRTDAIAPVGYARAQDLLLYSEVWAGYSNKPADENGHPPVALYTQDQVDMLLTALRAQLAERDAEIVALKGRLHEIAEEWAGAECGEPVTAQEGYAIGLCKRMYRLAAYPKE